MGCEAVERALEGFVAACRSDVERIRGEWERIGVLLAAREAELARAVTAQEVLTALPGVHPPTVEVKFPAPRGGSATAPVEVGGALARAEAREEFTAQVLDLLSASRVPMRCKDVVTALGGDAEVAREVEKVRHHLKRAKREGLVREREAGLFTLTRGVSVVSG